MGFLYDATEAEGCGGRGVFDIVLLPNKSGAETLHRCGSGGDAMKRRGRRVDCDIAKLCDIGGDLILR